MSVSHRVTGSWAELAADGTVAIPATPQAGDRMFLFARWKDFSVTASVANWTELTEFADGTTSSGNGTGSVKVGCWYRDWQSGDSDPTIDFSANPNSASVVITVMQKGADDNWLTPLFVTAAMTNWTTTSQTVSASSTVAVPSAGVVMGLVGIRDDTATMTRPTNGIDDASSAVTWNGDYVESPSTHHSTTTGDDGAADLGYRLVTTGATATLRMTGTISASETGSALWVVQGISVTVTPSTRSLTLSTFAPTLILTVVPVTTSLAATGFAPTVQESVTPPAASLTLSSQAPQLQELLTVPAVALSLTSFAPTVQFSVTPSSETLSLSTFSPTVTLARVVTVPNASLILTTSRPHVQPYQIAWLDPGGDAVQAVGYFNTLLTGTVSFDTTQKVVGVGSWKFDSGGGAGAPAAVKRLNVLAPGGGDNSRRISFYWRYDSVPDATETITKFNNGTTPGNIYSGGGFDSGSGDLHTDNGAYVTATPARNAGQGHVVQFSNLAPPTSAVIDSVKIIYERKYDVNTSIGISRVKYRIDGVEGPNHDNTDMPLTDTVVTVDVTADRSWEPQDFGSSVFVVIAEARRGDTDTSHTQSWDYVKVEVVFHSPVAILRALTSSSVEGFRLAVTPKGSGVVLGFISPNEYGFYGITEILPNTWPRISLAYVHNGSNDLDIKVFVNSVEELSIEGATTASQSQLPDLEYGWIVNPGASHVCWFDQIYIDKGDDLADPGNKLMTAKLTASTNENEWDTTGGTGAVNERPPNTTNHKKHTGAALVRQSYTLQTAATGDVDISGKTVVGYMGWAWAALEFDDFDSLLLIVNGTDGIQILDISTSEASPSMVPRYITSSTYPSNAAGIGMSYQGLSNITLHECGVVVCYEGPDTDDPLFPLQLLQEDASASVSDNMGGSPPALYELYNRVTEVPNAVVTTTISSRTADGEVPQQQAIIENRSGEERGITVVYPGIETSDNIDVAGADTPVELRRVDQIVV